MFNNPRAGNGQRYTDFGASFVDENPLRASTAYDGLDPWSAAPSPSPPPHSQSAQPNPVLNSVLADATVPDVYQRAFSLVDPTNSGETSVSSLSRVLGTSGLQAVVIDKIVNLVSSRSRVSRTEFFVALALVALAQSGRDVSIEQVASLSSQNSLPEPSLDLDSMPPPTSSFFGPSPSRNNSTGIPAPIPQYASDNPWSKYRKFSLGPNNDFLSGGPAGSSANFSASGLPNEWWKMQDTAQVSILGQQGFILNRYLVYQVSTDHHQPVHRRYSEFVYLWDCLTKRYPFRLFPALPPKRIGADQHFIEQRRRGLARSLTFVLNHPIMGEDSILHAFLTEQSFEAWRKHTEHSLEEESVNQRVDRVEEMNIPSDLDDKIATVKSRLGSQMELWQRICILVERIIKRREAAAVRMSAFRRTYLPTHFRTSPLLFTPPTSPLSGSRVTPASPMSRSSSLSQSLSTSSLALALDDWHDQGDLSRLTNTLRAVAELNEESWREDGNVLASGSRRGVEKLADHTERQSELAESRTRALLDGTLEALKSQRDLYIATRDLFIRNDHLSKDQVDRLKKRVETTSAKLETVQNAKKAGYEEEEDKLRAQITKDKAAIDAQLARRVFIRACLWHELRVVLHNRENTLLTLAVQEFAREEQEYSERVHNTWVSLSEAMENIPLTDQ